MSPVDNPTSLSDSVAGRARTRPVSNRPLRGRQWCIPVLATRSHHMHTWLLLLGLSFAFSLSVIRTLGKSQLVLDDYGLPCVIGGDSVADVWNQVGVFFSLTFSGYAHGQDRLFQIFLRLATANGRLSEFLGPGTNDANVDSDISTLMWSYSPEELEEQFSQVDFFFCSIEIVRFYPPLLFATRP